MRAGTAGLLLIAAGALVWVALVPSARARALELASERARLEKERDVLADRVAELERQRGPGSGSGSPDLGPVELRAAVVEALEGFGSGHAVRLDVQGSDSASPGVRLAVSGELDEVLTLVEALTRPLGPLVVSRLDLRPSGLDDVQLQLQALLPETGS